MELAVSGRCHWPSLVHSADNRNHGRGESLQIGAVRACLAREQRCADSLATHGSQMRSYMVPFGRARGITRRLHRCFRHESGRGRRSGPWGTAAFTFRTSTVGTWLHDRVVPARSPPSFQPVFHWNSTVQWMCATEYAVELY